MHHGQVSREDLRSVRSQRRVHPGRVGGQHLNSRLDELGLALFG